MTRTLFAAALMLCGGYLLTPALGPHRAAADHHESGKDKKAMKQSDQRLLRHVVLFKFKDSATEEEIAKIEKAFAALPDKIDAIHDFEWGTNNSPEGLDQGYTHCFLVTFKSEQARAEYLPHPAHKEFVKLLGPSLEEAHVFDYWAKE